MCFFQISFNIRFSHTLLLLQSYEWALEAMKYVSSMKMEHSTTAEGLDKLMKSLTIYLSEHPPIPEESFAAMLEAAHRLNNDKLLEQCRLAKARCQVSVC